MSQTEIANMLESFPGRFEYRSVEGSPAKAECVGYYPDGSFEFQYALIDGVLNGPGRSWHSNGQLQCEELYKCGHLHGKRMEWYPSGKPKSVAFYRNGLLDGPRRKWDENGQIICDERYILGRRHETRREWHPSGALMSETSYVDNVPVGTSRSWYENGNLKTQCQYVKGRMEGPSLRWFPGGRLKFRTNYMNGLRNGIGKRWDENGRLLYTKIYVHNYPAAEKTAGLLHSGKITARDIISIPNTAIRRICLEEFGYGRFLSQVEHEVMDRSGDTELICLNWHKKEEPMTLVKVKCATTGAYYVLRVPPRVQTAKQAVAWTFGMSPEEYTPATET